MPTRKRVRPDEKLSLKLTAAERKLVLEGLTCLDQEIEQIVKDTPAGEPVRMTLDDLDEFGGYVAAEANHCKDKSKGKKLDAIFGESAWEVIEAKNPEMWSEFKSTDVEAMLDELVDYKKKHFLYDQRRVLTCGIPNGSIRVEWLPPVAPGVDSKWEIQLYGLVRTGEREQAISFLRETRRLSRTDAEKQVKKIASDLGMA